MIISAKFPGLFWWDLEFQLLGGASKRQGELWGREGWGGGGGEGGQGAGKKSRCVFPRGNLNLRGT